MDTNNEIKNELILLNKEIIEETLGVSDFTLITDLEIIFTSINIINSLSLPPSLETLSLINNNLQQIEPLGKVSKTLKIIKCIDQPIKSVSFCFMRALKELYLVNCRLNEIPILTQCPYIEILWLSHNNITKLENLHSLSHLNILALQDNQIDTINNIDNLQNLQELYLANNPLLTFDSLYFLKNLINLKILSLNEDTFGKCPVIDLDGYKEYVVMNIKGLKYLDGIEINEKTRQLVQDDYREKVFCIYIIVGNIKF